VVVNWEKTNRPYIERWIGSGNNGDFAGRIEEIGDVKILSGCKNANALQKK